MPAAEPARDVAASFDVCGVRIDAVGPDQARKALVTAQFGEPRAVHLCNAYTLSLAVRDEGFRSLLNRGDLNFADGYPVAAVGRRRGHRTLDRRVYGPDLMLATLDAGRGVGLRHYLYGGSDQVLHHLSRRLQERFPGVRVVGAEAPPFRPLAPHEERAAALRIRQAQPDIVWVGLGTPRQDVWVDQQRDVLGSTLVAVGAAFDFLAGAKRQAPAWMQDHGLEWAYRLLTEPRRLWRRYLVGNAIFLAALTREELKARR